MEQWKELFQKAASEGLIPFMLASSNGTRAKKNTVRLFEIALIVVPLIVSLVYFGGKTIKTLETVSKTQLLMQQRMMEMHNKQHSMELNMTRIGSDLRNHMGYTVHDEEGIIE
ncbi:hypothetical protein KAR91_51510 [Candidatus Pacearchaeota archaeon]|nr:hypothetical protein [Candidatus Pacearchaeota archaeon]